MTGQNTVPNFPLLRDYLEVGTSGRVKGEGNGKFVICMYETRI
jgi:hypothetical protein